MIEIETMGGKMEISSESFVNISKNEYEELVRDSERLAVLESHDKKQKRTVLSRNAACGMKLCETGGATMSNKIHLPARRIIVPNEQGTIKLSKEAMTALVKIANETSLSLRMVASEIILQVANNGLINLDRNEE